MTEWTLEKINDMWVLQNDTDRERMEHRVYGTDLELGAFLRDACNEKEQRDEELRPRPSRGPITVDEIGEQYIIGRIWADNAMAHLKKVIE